MVSAKRGFVAKRYLRTSWHLKVVLEKIASTNDQTNKELRLDLLVFIQRLCKSANSIAYIHNKTATVTNSIR